MITLSAAVKAGAVCLSLLSPEVQFCKLTKMHLDAVCMRDGCRTPKQLPPTGGSIRSGGATST